MNIQGEYWIVEQMIPSVLCDGDDGCLSCCSSSSSLRVTLAQPRRRWPPVINSVAKGASVFVSREILSFHHFRPGGGEPF